MRFCKDCEYHRKSRYWNAPRCHLNSPIMLPKKDNSTGHFPTINDEDFCSKWEPKWHENPSIKEAWEQFIMVHKIITSSEEKS